MILASPMESVAGQKIDQAPRCKPYLLLFPERKQTDPRNFNDFEAYSGNITLRFSTTTETRDEDFIVLVNEIETTVVLEEPE